MPFQLRYWNAPPDDKRFDPLSSPFDDMPPDTFDIYEAAMEAAWAYIKKYAAKGGGSAGGYNELDDLFWIRDEVAPDKWRFTEFTISSV